MKRNIIVYCLLIAFLCSAIGDTSVFAQNKKIRNGNSRKAPASSVTGKPLRLTLVDGSEISGRLVKLDMKEVTYQNNVGDKIPVSLERISLIAIGEPPKPQIDTTFINDAQEVINTVARVASAVEKDLSYNEYLSKITDVKVSVESFIARNSNHSEQQKLFDLMRKITRSYEAASPIWAKRIGADQRRSLSEDSSEIQAVLALYPSLKDTEYNQEGRYPTDKVIAWIWSKTAYHIKELKSQVNQLSLSK